MENKKVDEPSLFSGALHTFDMEDLLSPEPHKLPEGIFVSKFLPMFADTSGRTEISEWLNVAGNDLTPVQIIGPTGEVLFTVPPLLRQTKIPPKAGPQDSLHEMMTNYEQYASVAPQMGKNYLNEIIRAKIVYDPVDLEYLRTWNAIFRRYGYPEIEVSEQVSKAAGETPKSAETKPKDEGLGSVVQYEDV